MAYEITQPRSETPTHVVVTDYSVHRMGPEPGIRVVLAECVRVLEPFEAVAETQGATIRVPAWAGRDLLGREAFLVDQATLGTIVGWDPDTATATLSEEPAGPVADPVTLQAANNLGITMFREAVGGAKWEVWLSAGDPTSAHTLAELEGTASFTFAVTLLARLGIDVEGGNLVAALQGMARAGQTLEGMFAVAGEHLDQRRAAGEDLGAYIHRVRGVPPVA
jgi:hypothetical protein